MKNYFVRQVSDLWPWIGLSILLTGCSSGGSSSSPANTSNPNAGGVAIDYSLYSQATTVCSPLNGEVSNVQPDYTITYVNGLQGRLYDLIPGSPIPQNLAQQFQYSSDVGINLFLNDLNVPTRLFGEGFPNAAGQLLTNASGTPLIEYFGMQLQSSIQLSITDAPGAYQFAVISDDGSTFSIKTFGNNAFTTLINDDGVHPSTMKCATSPVTVNAYDQIPMQLQYFQGPRYEIAMILMWRPWPTDSADVQDPLCNTSGNYQFFDPTTSTPNANYQALLARGWKPLMASNYVIPEVSFNPCNVPSYFGAQ